MSQKKIPLLLHETANVWRNLLDKRLKPLGLSQAKWRALFYLSAAEKPLTQIELADKMGIEGASIVGLIDRLANEGWVNRQTELHDRRIRTIHLTKKAMSTIKVMRSTADKLRDELLAPLSQDEVNACLIALEKIKQQAEQDYENN